MKKKKKTKVTFVFVEMLGSTHRQDKHDNTNTQNKPDKQTTDKQTTCTGCRIIGVDLEFIMKTLLKRSPPNISDGGLLVAVPKKISEWGH